MGFYPTTTRMLLPVRTVAPTAPILTAEELQVHLRVDSNFDYDYINTLVFVATQMLDGYSGLLNICLITQTWTVGFDSFPWRTWYGDDRWASQGWPVSPSAVIRLPLFPVQSVTVTYYDVSNVQQTLNAANYGLYQDAQGWFISLNQGQTWPTTYTRPDAVTVTMVAGYGATASTIPLPIRHAAKMLVAGWYENRISVGQSTAEVDALIGLYKRSWVH